MLGIGVGFDTKGSKEGLIPQKPGIEPYTYPIPGNSPSDPQLTCLDSREGWVESVRRLIDSYFTPGAKTVEFDYSEIREKGSPIRGFGGVASGPDPLRRLHQDIVAVLDRM